MMMTTVSISTAATTAGVRALDLPPLLSRDTIRPPTIPGGMRGMGGIYSPMDITMSGQVVSPFY